MSVIIAIPQMGHEPSRDLAKSKYVESILRAGAQARWIELDDPLLAVEQALECDGLLLPGGGDIDPKYYGQAPIPACGEPNVLRDTAEPLMLEAFIKAKRPVLGICRGEQLINVFMGGTLLQDIAPLQKCEHANHWEMVHSVDIVPSSFLAKIIQQNPFCVNSCHHQAVDKIASPLCIVATSEDGFVEAVELKDADFFFMGVQWHPERLSETNHSHQRIFDLFVDACRKPY